MLFMFIFNKLVNFSKIFFQPNKDTRSFTQTYTLSLRKYKERSHPSCSYLLDLNHPSWRIGRRKPAGTSPTHSPCFAFFLSRSNSQLHGNTRWTNTEHLSSICRSTSFTQQIQTRIIFLFEHFSISYFLIHNHTLWLQLNSKIDDLHSSSNDFSTFNSKPLLGLHTTRPLSISFSSTTPSSQPP